MFIASHQGTGAVLKLFVQPKAKKKTSIIGLHGDRIKIAVAAPPVDGKANKEVINFLSRLFSVKKKDITFISGERSRQKNCLVKVLTEEEVRRRIETILFSDD